MDISLQKLVRNSSLNIFGTVLNRFSRYFIVLIAIKVLGVTNYGYYVIGLTLVSIGQIVGTLGLNYGVFRFIPIFRSRGEISKVKGIILFCLSRAFWLSAGVGVILFFFADAIASNLFDKPGLLPFIQVLTLSLPLMVISTILISVFKGFNVIKYKIILEDIVIIHTKILLFLGCLYFGLGTNGILYSYVISLIVGVGLGAYLLLRLFPDLKNRDVKSSCDRREVLSFSIPLSMGGVMNTVLRRTDILTLTYFLSASHVGIYSIAQKLAQLVFFVSSSTFAVFSPTIAELLGSGERAKMQEYLKKTTRWALIATLPVFMVIVIFSESILTLFGKEFVDGTTVLLILAISFLLNSVIGFSGQVLTVVGRTKLIFANSLVAGVLNLGLNLFLIPKYGVLGAALATGFSVFAVNVARTLEVYFLEDIVGLELGILGPAIVGISSGGIILYLKLLLSEASGMISVVALVLLFCVIYTSATLIFILNDEDRFILKRLIKSFISR